MRLRAHRGTAARFALAGFRSGPRGEPGRGPRCRNRGAHGDRGSGGSITPVREGSGGLGSAFTAQYTTRQRYTIGIFKTNIMKTNSQTSIEAVYDTSPATGFPLWDAASATASTLYDTCCDASQINTMMSATSSATNAQTVLVTRVPSASRGSTPPCCTPTPGSPENRLGPTEPSS